MYIISLTEDLLTHLSFLTQVPRYRCIGGNETTPINEFTVTQNQVGIYWNVFELTVGANNSVNIETIDTYSNAVLYQ